MLHQQGDRYVLRQRHQSGYYYQVMGELAITGAQWCDLVVWTPKGMAVASVQPDPDFFFVHMYPALWIHYLQPWVQAKVEANVNRHPDDEEEEAKPRLKDQPLLRTTRTGMVFTHPYDTR